MQELGTALFIHKSGKKMVRFTDDQILEAIAKRILIE